jgi:hypothetical protein
MIGHAHAVPFLANADGNQWPNAACKKPPCSADIPDCCGVFAMKINLPCLTLPWPRARPRSRSRSRRRAGMQRAQRCDGTPVAELYTSKGCSSSPRADRWLSKLTAQPEVVVLSDKSSAATTIPLPPGFANRLTEQIGANVVWVDGRNNDTYVAKASPRYYDHFVLRIGSPYRGVSEAALGLRLHLVQLEGLSCRGKAKVYSLTTNGSLRSHLRFIHR